MAELWPIRQQAEQRGREQAGWSRGTHALLLGPLWYTIHIRVHRWRGPPTDSLQAFGPGRPGQSQTGIGCLWSNPGFMDAKPRLLAFGTLPFAERKVPQQCLGGNKSTSTGFLSHCQSSPEIYSMRNTCKLSSYYLRWLLCTLITLAYSLWVNLKSVTVPIIIWTAHVWQRIVLVLPLPPRPCCGTFLSAKTLRTGVY